MSESRGRSSAARRRGEGGFYKSTDGGEHFTKITTGLPTELVGKANLAVTAANPNRIYALVEAKPGAGLYRSDEQGESWKQVNSTIGQLITRPFYYTTLGADPTNADVVYGGAETFYKSTDGGANCDDDAHAACATITTSGSTRRTGTS